MSTEFKAKRPGYVCDCIFGSPRVGVVIAVPSLHERDCPIRRRIIADTIEVRGTPQTSA